MRLPRPGYHDKGFIKWKKDCEEREKVIEAAKKMHIFESFF